MIEGVVNSAYEAVITLPLQGPSGQMQEVEAVVDTGFNRFLTLPPDLVNRLGLQFMGEGRLVLANGSEESFGMYGVTVLWDGHRRYIGCYSAGATPLVGMALMDDHSLYVEVNDGGLVAIRSTGQT